MTVEDYLKERVDNQINWYEKKSSRNKRYYLLSNSLIIVFAALIPLLAGVTRDATPITGYLLAVLGVLTAIVTGLSALFKFNEKWTNYRITAETLRREKILFKTGSGPYTPDNLNFNLLVSRIEGILGGENESWSRINHQTEAQKPGDTL